MSAALELEREPVLATENEAQILRRIDDLFASTPHQRAKLVGPSGETITLPTSVYKLLRQMVHELAQGNAVTIVPVHAELTTQQAADLLNISRPFLIKLLEAGEIPYHRTGTHRRILFNDLMEYRRNRDRIETEALDEMARMAEDMGMYG